MRLIAVAQSVTIADQCNEIREDTVKLQSLKPRERRAASCQTNTGQYKKLYDAEGSPVHLTLITSLGREGVMAASRARPDAEDVTLVSQRAPP